MQERPGFDDVPAEGSRYIDHRDKQRGTLDGNGMFPYPLHEQARPIDQVTTMPCSPDHVDDSYQSFEDILYKDTVRPMASWEQKRDEPNHVEMSVELDQLLNSFETDMTPPISYHRMRLARQKRAARNATVVSNSDCGPIAETCQTAAYPSDRQNRYIPTTTHKMLAARPMSSSSSSASPTAVDQIDSFASHHSRYSRHRSKQAPVESNYSATIEFNHVNVDGTSGRDTATTDVLCSDRNKNSFSPNDVQMKIYLDDLTDARFDSLVNSLKQNKTTRSINVVLTRTDKSRLRSSEQAETFFRTLYIVPTLQVLAVHNLDESDLRYLPFVLQGQATIRSLTLRFASGTADRQLLQTLSTLPRLDQLEIEVHASFAVGTILMSKSCEVLKVVGSTFQFEATDVLGMLKPLANNTKLKTLELGPTISGLPMKVLPLALRTNITLAELRVSFEATQKDGEEVVRAMSDTLSVNRTLKVLWNHSYLRIQISQAVKEQFLAVLAANRTLRKFHLFDEDADFWVEKTAIMERNKTRKPEPWSWLMSLLCMSG